MIGHNAPTTVFSFTSFHRSSRVASSLLLLFLLDFINRHGFPGSAGDNQQVRDSQVFYLLSCPILQINPQCGQCSDNGHHVPGFQPLLLASLANAVARNW